MKNISSSNDLKLNNKVSETLSNISNNFRHFLNALVTPNDYRDNFDIIVEISHFYPDIIFKNFELILNTFPSSYTMNLFEVFLKDNPHIIDDNNLFEYVYTLTSLGIISDTTRFIELLLKSNRKDLLLDKENQKVIFKSPKISILHLLEEREENDLLDIYAPEIIKNMFQEGALSVVEEFFYKNFYNKNSKLFENNIMSLLEVAPLKDREDIIFFALAHNDLDSNMISQMLPYLRRGDITNLIRDIINETHSNVLECFDMASIKKKLIDAFIINENSKNSNGTNVLKLFDAQKDKEQILKSSRYAKILDILKDDVYNQKEKEEELDLILREYEIKNLIQILSEENLPLRNKYLNEIIENMRIANLTIPNLKTKSSDKIYYEAKELLMEEFYEILGLAYGESKINQKLQNDLRFGIEIEEIFLKGSEAYLNDKFYITEEHSLNYKSKDAVLDTSIIETIVFNDASGEYTSEVMSISNLEDFRAIRTQLDILTKNGATTNSTCGFHVHISTPNTLELFYHNYLGYKLLREMNFIQDALIDKLNVFSSRENHIEPIETRDIDKIKTLNVSHKRSKILNLQSIYKHDSIEFRLFNLPDYLDKKVVEAYIDFAASFYDYIEEGNSIIKDFEEETSTKGISFVAEEENEYIFGLILEKLPLSEDTQIILQNMDQIFEFHNVKDINYSSTLSPINYYDSLNMSIKEADRIRKTSLDTDSDSLEIEV